MLSEIDFESVSKAFKEHGIFWAIGIGAVALAWFIWHELLDDPIKEHLFRRHIKRRILKKSFAEDLVSETFEGKVTLVTLEQLEKKASKERILQFYGGAKLDWDIIAANGDIPRDQSPELKVLAENASTTTHLLCVTAEAGAGKSTLAWRIVADLVRQEKDILIIHITANEDADVWQRMPDFQREIKRPMLVMVDDIFRDQEAANAFIDLPPQLPLTIVATSRRNEYTSRARRLKCRCTEFQLKPPSKEEKGRILERVLEKLGKSRADVTTDQRRRLDKAGQFIVLMIELVGGKELHEIIRDTIEKLYELESNHSAYHAYNYLCFSGQFSVSMPVTLLEKLSLDFYGISNRRAIDSIIFSDPSSGFVWVGHPVVAKSAADFYAKEKGCSPNQTLQEIITVLDDASPVERRFLAQLLQGEVNIQLLDVNSSLFSLTKNLVARCVQKSESTNELVAWRNFYLVCGQHNLADKCVELAMTRPPTSQNDCHLLLHLCRQQKREEDAFQAIAKRIKSYPTQGAGRVSFLGLVEKYARNDIPNVIREMSQWLDANPSDTYVRTRFLLFVERNQKETLGHHLGEVEKWLEGQHADDSYVRAAYLGVVERNGTGKQIEEAITKTNQWLEKPENTNDVDNRQALLGLQKRKWTKHQQDQSASSNTSDEWLKKKGLVSEISPFEQILKNNIDWLKQHPTAKEIWDTLLGLLFFLGRGDEARDLVLEAISHHPDDQNLLTHYLHALYQGNANHEEVKRTFNNLIKENPRHLGAKISHAAWLRDAGDPQEAKEYYQQIIAEHPDQPAPHFGLGQSYLSAEQYDEAAAKFDYVLKMRGGFSHQMAHEGLGHALWKMGKLTEAEKEIRLAIKWADKKEQPTARFYTLLGRLYLDWSIPRWTDAIKAFETAKDADPDYYGNCWGIGRALFGLGKFAEASDALRKAMELKPDLGPPASDEINALLDQCQQKMKPKTQPISISSP